MKILIVVNVDWFFISHRLPIAIAALRAGHDVCIATTFTSSANKSYLQDLGFSVFDLFIDRSGKNPLSFLHTFFRLFSLGCLFQPHIVHLVTIQPVLLGAIALRLAGCKRFVYAISGLGHVFLGSSFNATLRRFFIVLLYRFALSSKYRFVLFQNQRDKSLLSTCCSIPESDSILISGSGVDLSKFTRTPLLPEPFIIVFASRLLISKGVLEFINAAHILKKKFPSLRFQLVGNPDPSNPLSISRAQITKWVSDGVVDYLGYRDDLPVIMSRCHIVCLPSYYPEGLPKVLCEAAACGRAVITSNEPGCRDAVVDGVTGVLVPSRNSQALASAIEHLISSPDTLASMGSAARRHAEANFNLDNIVNRHLDIYNQLSALPL